VLRIIQRFDPIGCGARDLRECLLIQARWFLPRAKGGRPRRRPAARRHHRPPQERETKKYQSIAKDLHVPLDEVGGGGEAARAADPKPGRRYATDEPQYITPDVYIHKIGDQYVTVLNDDGLSKLRISAHRRAQLVLDVLFAWPLLAPF